MTFLTSHLPLPSYLLDWLLVFLSEINGSSPRIPSNSYYTQHSLYCLISAYERPNV